MARKTGKDIRVSMDSDYETRRKKELAEYGGYEKYEVEGWADTLQKAAEVLSDPKKMKAVAKCLDKKEQSLELLKAFSTGKFSKGKE